MLILLYICNYLLISHITVDLSSFLFGVSRFSLFSSFTPINTKTAVFCLGLGPAPVSRAGGCVPPLRGYYSQVTRELAGLCSLSSVQYKKISIIVILPLICQQVRIFVIQTNMWVATVNMNYTFTLMEIDVLRRYLHF